MTNATIGALRVEMGLDSAAFTAGQAKVQQQMKTMGQKMQAMGATIAKAGVGIGLAMGAAAATAGTALIRITGDLADLSAEAKTAGVSFESFQSWKFIAEQARVGVDALTDGLKEMQLRADEFAKTGAGSAAEAFKRIGLSGDQLTEALKNPSAMFEDILGRIGKLDTAAQIRVSDEIFGGTGGEQFVRLLALGEQGIAKLKEQFAASGGLIPAEQVAKAEQFQAALAQVKTSLNGIVANALLDSGMLEWFTKIAPQVGELGKQLTKTLGPVILPMFEAVGAAVKGLAAVFTAIFDSKVQGPGGQVITFGEVIKRVFGAVVQIVTGVFKVLGDTLNAFAALLRGDWSAMWGHLGNAVKTVADTVVKAFSTLAPEAIAAMKKMAEGVAVWMTGKLFGVFRSVIEKVKGVSDAFFKLYDAVVGHSFIPDMVIEIGQWMARLDDAMVKPAQRATTATGQAFEDVRDQANAAMMGLLTDAERSLMEYNRLAGALQRGIAQGGPDAAVWKNGLARLNAGRDAEGLTMPDTIGDIVPIDTSSVQAAMDSINAGIEASREKFADAFEYGIDSAIRGDWQGVLQAIVGESFQNGLKSIGRALFNSFGDNGAGGGFDLSKIGSAAASIFGKLPKFAGGGTFRPATSGGIA